MVVSFSPAGVSKVLATDRLQRGLSWFHLKQAPPVYPWSLFWWHGQESDLAAITPPPADQVSFVIELPARDQAWAAALAVSDFVHAI
jgi:hypothetical protein